MVSPAECDVVVHLDRVPVKVKNRACPQTSCKVGEFQHADSTRRVPRQEAQRDVACQWVDGARRLSQQGDDSIESRPKRVDYMRVKGVVLQKGEKLPLALNAGQFSVEFIELNCVRGVEDVGPREVIVHTKLSIQTGGAVILSRDMLANEKV